MRRTIGLVLALLATFTAVAGAQKKEKEPKRPKVADANDPNAYYYWGIQQLARYPDDAADAFYWAIRLSPGWADAYYARWAALHLQEPNRLVSWWSGDKGTRRSKDVMRIDSLRLRATELNPFLYRKFERQMLQTVIEQAVKQRNQGIDQAELADAIREYLANGDAETKAENAYVAGNFPFALEEWAADLPSWKNKSYPHAERGRIFYLLAAYDSAGAEFASAIGEKRSEDKNELVVFYDSKAIYEHSLGMINERQGNLDAAREAYGRALQEDLSYSPAHLALSAMDLAKGDTAGAISEMDIATQVGPPDGYTMFVYGRTLLYAAHDQEALAQLKKSVEMEPYYAEPHVFLAAIYDNAGFKDEAMAEYAKFVELSTPRDGRVERVKARLAKMKGDSTVAQTPTKP